MNNYTVELTCTNPSENDSWVFDSLESANEAKEALELKAREHPEHYGETTVSITISE